MAAFNALFTVAVATMAAAAPTINVWYGNNQSFGQIGNPQTAINILGNVSDSNGVSSLSYTLNGGTPVNLSRGPDSRRLLSPGDFNIDINTSSLNNGSNTVVITATNSLNETSTATVTVQYSAGNIWPANYSINWSAGSSIQSVAQVVDGHWTLSGGTVHPTYLGYDRLLGIGDRTWSDYEVTVPITIHNIDSSGFAWPSLGPGVGLLFRWTGHTDNPIPGWQPKTGYLPFGAIGWYSWDNAGGGVRLKLVGNNLYGMQEDSSGFMLTFDVTYIFKMRVETIPGQGGAYKFKVWQQGQTEPATWRLQGTQSLSDPQYGSICLLSHHVNADFGNVTIVSLSAGTVQASLKALLQGPYTTPGDTMRTSLRPMLPLSQPYSASPWNYGGSEAVAAIPNDVVDWVLLELRTGTSPSTKVATRAAFIKRNGMIVDLDGVSTVSFTGVASANYYVVVRHRNHLPVMTASAQGLSPTATVYDFTTSQSQAFGTLPMTQVAPGVFALYAGDTNVSLIISSADADNIFGSLNSTNYNLNDVNMSGIVSAADANVVFGNLNRTSQVP